MANKIKIDDEIKERKSISDICHSIAEGLISVYNFKTISGKKDDEIWVYGEGIYEPKGRDLIKVKVEERLGRLCKTHYVNEVINKIARKTFINRENMGCKDLNLICVNNGVLNLTTRELLPHSANYRFTNKLNIDYNPSNNCNKVFEFLSDVLQEEDIPCIQEWFGYQLYRVYCFKKAVIFRGIPDTGKTTFMNMFINFIGEKNCSSLGLQSLSLGKWHVIDLYNKNANVCDDLSEKDIVDVELFKQVTGRSQIQAEYKFGDQFRFTNYAKLTFACNKIPIIRTNTDDEAYWNRWMIFDFDNVFNITNKNVDTNISSKISTPKEMSGLLNWALDGLDRLKKQGFFGYRRDWEENRRIMQGEASSIARFVNGCLLNETGNWVSNSDLYENYVEFCKLNKISVIETERKFFLDIRVYCNYGKFNSNKDNVFGVRNVKIKDVLLML